MMHEDNNNKIKMMMMKGGAPTTSRPKHPFCFLERRPQSKVKAGTSVRVFAETKHQDEG